MTDIIEPKFKVGDVVQLKSGGQSMTVSSVEANLGRQSLKFDQWTGYIWCNWFVDTELKAEKFHQDSLRLSE